MNKHQTYRLVAAYFFAVLIIQVIFLQGAHHFVAHDHGEACNVEGVHIHSEEHAHFSCDICLFQFTPTELSDNDVHLSQPIIANQKVQYKGQRQLITQIFLQTNLRGPPRI